MTYTLPEQATFESLRYWVPRLARELSEQEVRPSGIITVVRDGPQVDSLALSSLSVELNNLYNGVYKPVRYFSSPDVQLRQMSDALRWLVNGEVDNVIGINADTALALIGLTSFDLAQLLLTQFEASNAEMENLYADNVRALLVLDKLGATVINADSDALVDQLELRPAIIKPMSRQEAVLMTADDLAHTRALLSQAIVSSQQDVAAACATLMQRLMPQKELLERHRLTPLSRRQAACGDVSAYLIGL